MPAALSYVHVNTLCIFLIVFPTAIKSLWGATKTSIRIWLLPFRSLVAESWMTRSPFILADLNRSLELYLCAGSKRESMNPRFSKATCSIAYLCQALCAVGPANSLWSPILQWEKISGQMWKSEYSFYPNYWPLPPKLPTDIILRCWSTFHHETRWER